MNSRRPTTEQSQPADYPSGWWRHEPNRPCPFLRWKAHPSAVARPDRRCAAGPRAEAAAHGADASGTPMSAPPTLPHGDDHAEARRRRASFPGGSPARLPDGRAAAVHGRWRRDRRRRRRGHHREPRYAGVGTGVLTQVKTSASHDGIAPPPAPGPPATHHTGGDQPVIASRLRRARRPAAGATRSAGTVLAQRASVVEGDEPPLPEQVANHRRCSRLARPDDGDHPGRCQRIPARLRDPEPAPVPLTRVRGVAGAPIPSTAARVWTIVVFSMSGPPAADDATVTLAKARGSFGREPPTTLLGLLERGQSLSACRAATCAGSWSRLQRWNGVAGMPSGTACPARCSVSKPESRS